jgi:hypothetical protein
MPEEMIVEWGAEADEADEAWEADEGYDEADDSVEDLGERTERRRRRRPGRYHRPGKGVGGMTMRDAAGRKMSPSRRGSPRPPRPIAASPARRRRDAAWKSASTAWRDGTARSRRTPARFPAS